MASHRFVDHPNRLRDSFPSELRRGRSKAQMCLHKILALISSQASPQTLKASSSDVGFSELGDEAEENRGFDVDLNLKIGSPPPQTVDFNYPSPGGGGSGGDCEVSDAVVSMAEKSSVGECDPKEEIENLNGSDWYGSKDEDESETTNPLFQSSEIDDVIEARGANNPQPEVRNDDCLHLLIEAANLISGEDTEKEKPSQNDVRKEFVGEKGSQTKRGHCWTAEVKGDDVKGVSPVVRSKRGRNQVLPQRYRDSVLEPLTRLSRHRSTSFSTRRRSR